MSGADDLSKLSPTQIFLYCLGFASTFGPGSLIIYFYRKKDFFDLATAKLAILAIAMTLPIVLLFYLLNRVIAKDRSASEGFLIASHTTSVGSFAALFLAYEYSLNFPQFATLYMASSLVLCVLLSVLAKQSST
jgi:hypothetical protein